MLLNTQNITPLITKEFPLGKPSGNYGLNVIGTKAEVFTYDKNRVLVSIENIDANTFDNPEIAEKISLKTFVKTYGADTIIDYITGTAVNNLLK